jgi:hypothetical protein
VLRCSWVEMGLRERKKEDLFYYRLEAFGASLVDAIGTRAAGEPVLAAFRTTCWRPVG